MRGPQSVMGCTNCSTATRQLPASRRMLREFPEIIDVHFWAQFPGESVDSGSARIEYIARDVLPRVRANLMT
jgi:hypothetical protein